MKDLHLKVQQKDGYAEQFSTGKILYKRFSPSEQYGCCQGGKIHVIASLLAGAKVGTDQLTAPEGSFKREQQLAKIQEKRIEDWAKAAGFWISNTDETYEQTLGEKIAQGGEAVVYDMGFKSINPRNWTFANKDIYLSDMHDENVLLSPNGHICVIDCDIRINIPELRTGGTRILTNEVEFQ